jgi:hypothetical protein
MEMKFTKTFEVDRSMVNRIPTFMAIQHYELEMSSPSYYRFKRGSGLVFIKPTFDIIKIPTTVDISLMEAEGDRLQVLVNYNVSGKGTYIFTSEEREKIMAEIENLELFAKVK